MMTNGGEGFLEITSTVLSRMLEVLDDAVDDIDDNNATDFKNDTNGYEQDYGYGDGYDGKEEDPVPTEFSVLSVDILTLGLLVLVEAIRHWCDRQAHGKPFVIAVLLTLYSELATLGIVEFAVFVLMKYYDVDKEKKGVFEDVHFALFYTVVFNAFQSSLTAIFTCRSSHLLWARTEQLELDHYVEIREEYERLSSLIGKHNARSRVEKWVRNCYLSVRRPGLRRNYKNLRMQVRFHELRLQFLEAHQLPLNLKVCDYLKRSEMGVLIGLVHISITAWLFLTGGLVLLYFVLGMVGYKSADVDVLGTSMTGVFFGVLFAFNITSLALQYKMERIFQSIMKTKIDDSDKETGQEAQKNLFWFGSPSLVVSLIQFMNFGYAIALAIVIMYWPYFTHVEPFWYLMAVFGCYFVFLYDLSVLVPQFTLCTSLGYLTNYKQLQETLAHHRFEEAQRQQQREMIERAVEPDSAIVMARPDGVGTRKAVASVMYRDTNGILSVDDDPREKLLAELVKCDTTTLRKQLPEKSTSRLLEKEQTRRPVHSKAVPDSVAAIRASGGVLGDSRTKSDPLNSHITSRKERMTRRHNTRKSISQPELIKGWQDITAAEPDRFKVYHSVDDAELNRRMSKSESGVIRAWQDTQGISSMNDSSSHSKSGAFEQPSFVKRDNRDDAALKWTAARPAELRHAGTMAQSASAVVRSWRDFSVTDPAPEKVGSHEASLDMLSAGSTQYDQNLWRSEGTSHIRDNDQQAVFEEEEKKDFDGVGSSSNNAVDLADNSKKPRTLAVNEEDYGTSNAGESVGNLSDVDVIETIRGITATNMVETVIPLHTRFFKFCSIASLARVARHYFVGTSYPEISHLSGTLVVFVFVGHRVEAFIALSGFVIDIDNFVWETNLLNIYWAEVAFLTCFIVADFIILTLFHSWKSIDSRTVSLSALLDLILTGTVMILLFVAEAQRCCIDESPENTVRLLVDRIGPDYNFEEECTCGRWGSRTYSGLGIIEPFTSLIALRIFRFAFATFLMKRLDKVKGTNVESSSEDTKNEYISVPDPQSHEQGNLALFDHGLGRATAVELWGSAITEHPELVEKYGQFSGELLRAMLGLHVDVHASEKVSSLSPAVSAQAELSEREENTEYGNKPETWQSHIKLTGTKYAKLSSDAQGIIIAGRLGKPVKSMRNDMVFESPGGRLPMVREGIAQLTNSTSPGLAEFEVDKERMLVEQSTEFPFVAPFARLVRSMRRCDRRHLPLLTKWVSVDVVITQFEIVYFEAKDGLSGSEGNGSKDNERDLLSALQATKGGKGLRLCDVAVGRKVVGHLDLVDVREVHVEEDDDAASGVALLEKAAQRYHSTNDMAVEYWHDDSCCPLEADHKRYARAIRWTIMKEQRLKLITLSGTLVLRFYSDLECTEAEKHGNAAESLSRDIALQWAETVARIVGQDQLNQALPHFGENNDEALRDYLEVVRFHNKEYEMARKKTDRGADDLNFLYGDGGESVGIPHKVPSVKLKKSFLNRAISYGEREGGSERSAPRPNPLRSLHRSLSMGTARKAEDDECRIDPSIV